MNAPIVFDGRANITKLGDFFKFSICLPTTDSAKPMKVWPYAIAAIGLILLGYTNFYPPQPPSAPVEFHAIFLAGGYTLKHMYYINREIRKDRREVMEAILTKARVPYTRFLAVEADTVNVSSFIDSRKTPPSSHFSNQMTQRVQRFTIACFQSQIEVLQLIAQSAMSEMDLYAILEDDVAFTPYWTQALERSLGLLPLNWDVLRCDVRFPLKNRQLTPGFYRTNNTGLNHFHGTHFYVVTPQRAARILSALEDAPLDDIDLMMCNLDALNAYATSENRTLQVTTPFDRNIFYRLSGKSHSDHI
jgi:GR25 family glycosyltransferase involved in LPS biosynthesis